MEIRITPQDGAAIGAFFDFAPYLPDLLNRLPDGSRIIFEPGEYHFWPDQSLRRTIYISNTDSADYPEKHIGLLLSGKRGITLEGYGASLIFHGGLLAVAIMDCQDIIMEGFHIHYACPSTLDATVVQMDTRKGGASALIRFPDVYDCRIVDGSVLWQSEKSPYTGKCYWTETNGMSLTQHFRARDNKVFRTGEDLFYDYTAVEQEGPNLLRLHYRTARAFETGDVFQMRNTKRDASGFFLSCSKDLHFKNMKIGYFYSIGVIAQCSENIIFGYIDFKAAADGMSTCSAADTLHFSGCKGKIHVHHCQFVNPHDDHINIHGTYLKVARAEGKQMTLQYCHPQTLGFQSVFPGDILRFCRSDTLLPAGGTAKVVQSAGPLADSLDTIEVLLEQEPDFEYNDKLFAENISFLPDVLIEDNNFDRTPTRGLLLSSGGKMVIRNNRFANMYMACIYISGDASLWYESGAVNGVFIENNVFIDNLAHAVLIEPTNTQYADEKVHHHIQICHNHLENMPFPWVSVKSSDGVVIGNNTLINCGKNGEEAAVENIHSIIDII